MKILENTHLILILIDLSSPCRSYSHLVFNVLLPFSKINKDALRESIDNVLKFANETKKRKFTESIELQISLKNYDPQKDKRFSGTVK